MATETLAQVAERTGLSVADLEELLARAKVEEREHFGADELARARAKVEKQRAHLAAAEAEVARLEKGA